MRLISSARQQKPHAGTPTLCDGAPMAVKHRRRQAVVLWFRAVIRRGGIGIDVGLAPSVPPLLSCGCCLRLVVRPPDAPTTCGRSSFLCFHGLDILKSILHISYFAEYFSMQICFSLVISLSLCSFVKNVIEMMSCFSHTISRARDPGVTFDQSATVGSARFLHCH